MKTLYVILSSSVYIFLRVKLLVVIYDDKVYKVLSQMSGEDTTYKCSQKYSYKGVRMKPDHYIQCRAFI